MRVIPLGRGSLSGLPLIRLPFFADRVSAGFPSPAQDYVESTFDLNDLLVANPPATYFLRVQGDSMQDAGISDGDVLIVDRALDATHGDIVIASLYGEMTVKRLELKPALRLVPANPAYTPIDIPEPSELDLFGVVTYVIHATRQR